MRTLTLLVSLALAAGAAADSWLLPETKRICSADESHCVTVVPQPSSSAGGTATATLERRQSGGAYERVAQFPLLNPVSPVKVLVTAKGDVVTFDDWFTVGYGDRVVVLYRPDGTVVKQYSLEQLLSKERIEKVGHSVSSIWWGGDHFLDEKSGHIVLLIVAGNGKFEELRLDLATGNKVASHR